MRAFSGRGLSVALQLYHCCSFTACLQILVLATSSLSFLVVLVQCGMLLGEYYAIGGAPRELAILGVAGSLTYIMAGEVRCVGNCARCVM